MDLGWIGGGLVSGFGVDWGWIGVDWGGLVLFLMSLYHSNRNRFRFLTDSEKWGELERI